MNLPDDVISHISIFLRSDNLINFACCDKKLLDLTRYILNDRFKCQKARAKWKLIRNIVRLCHRITLTNKVLLIDNWIIEDMSPYPLIRNVIKKYNDDRYERVKLLVTIGTQDNLTIAIQWAKCLSNCFTHGQLKSTADKFVQCLIMRDKIVINEIPLWMLSITFHLSKIWHDNTGI